MRRLPITLLPSCWQDRTNQPHQATASAPHKGTRETNTSTNHLPPHTHHERPNTHYLAWDSCFVVRAWWEVLCRASSTRLTANFWFFLCIF